LLKVLVTGGFGYLGGRLAQALACSRDYDVTLATRRTIRPLASSAIITGVDWTSDVELQRACEGINAVVHLAGMNAADCASDPVAALECNGMCTARLLRAAVRQRVTRFLYLSTAHVYGAELKGCVDEQTRLGARHPYATSHRAGEDAVRFAHDTGAISGLVIRLSNSFGAPADPGVDCWSLVTNDMCWQAVNTRCMVLRSTGTQRRDFVPVSEVCRALAHLMAMSEAELGDGVFNVGGSWAPTILEMAEYIAARVEIVLGFRPRIALGTDRDSVGDQPLEYCVKKLISSGFDMRRDAVVEELDRLIIFCTQQPGRLGK